MMGNSLNGLCGQVCSFLPGRQISRGQIVSYCAEMRSCCLTGSPYCVYIAVLFLLSRTFCAHCFCHKLGDVFFPE